MPLLRRHLLLAPLAATLAGTAGAQSAAPAANPLALKLMIVGRRKPGSTLAEHRHHIRHVHGELVLRYIATDPANAPQRYVQNAVFDGQFRAGAPGTDAFALNRDFVTQIWVADPGALQRSVKTPFYLEQLKPDENHFVDQATVVFMMTRERELLAPTSAVPAGGVKLFGCLKRSAAASADDWKRAWSSAPEALHAAAAPRLSRHVQNDVFAPPAAPPTPLDGIDEFWLADEAAARALLGRWRQWVDNALVAKGLVDAGSAFALLANEQVLHAGPR